MASDASKLTNSDFTRSGGGFSFTGKLAEIARNADWVQGYEAVKSGSSSDRNGYSFMWEAISSAAEIPGNELYTSIRNYVDNIGNIDVCGLEALENYANELKISDDTINMDFEFPLEIKKLIEIFSVNTAYLFNKETDGTSDTLSLKNSIIHYTTIEKILDALKDRSKYIALVRDTFYNTLLKFINLNVGEIDRKYATMTSTDLIWKLNVSKLTDKLWDEEVDSDEDIYTLKNSLDIPKSFTERIFADDIIEGRRSMKDFTEQEQQVIEAEIKARETRYGNDTTLRYYYMRLFKVIEYFRFTTIAYRNAYNLSEYDIVTSKYVISDKTSDSDSIIKFKNGEYYIDENLIMNVAEWLADYSLELCNTRVRMKRAAQRNMMTGTKRVIVDVIREYLLDKIDSDTWKNIKTTTMFGAGLNKNFSVSLVEYVDPTEYFNIKNSSDNVNETELSINPRYWDGKYDDSTTFSNDDILKFYNKLTESHDTFVKNSEDESGSSEPNLYDFLSNLFEMGATSNSTDDIGSDCIEYIAKESTAIEATDTATFSGEPLSALVKFSGDAEIGSVPYVNEKNQYHPSYQVHPFLNAFEEYTTAYTGVMNLVNSFTASIDESRSKLDQRIDELGNTINFWLNWNEDFTGYSSSFEKGGDDVDSKFNQDSPFNFDALSEYLANDSFIYSVENHTNPYYISERTGLFILDDDETSTEVLRLKKFKSQIEKLSGMVIYRYGKDNYGNLYILYKDDGNRRNRNSLGDMWIRLKNHPIAFPMFDFDKTQDSFSTISCVKGSDNSKLISLISNILIKFESSYGTSSDGSKVVFDGLSLTTASNTTSGLATKNSDGSISEITASDKYSEYSESGSFTAVKPNNSVSMSAGSSYTYYIDSETGDVVEAGTAILSGGTDTLYASSKPFTPFLDSDIKASFSNGSCRIYSDVGPIKFVNYTYTKDTDPSTYFYYETDGGIKHAVSQHTIRVNSIYSGSISELKGTYDKSGTVSIGEFSETTEKTSNVSSLSSVGRFQTVDGSIIYEDFKSYVSSSFETRKDVGYSIDDTTRIDAVLASNSASSYGYIVHVGGSNPVFIEPIYDYSNVKYRQWTAGTSYSKGDYVKNYDSDSETMHDYCCITANSDTSFDSSKWRDDGEHNDIDDTGIKTVSVNAFLLTPTSTFDRKFVISSDSFYHPTSRTSTKCSSFTLSAIEFAADSDGYISDTIRPFYNYDRSNIYYPYTDITPLYADSDDESLEEIDSPIQSITIDGIKLYYKVIPNDYDSVAISGMDIDSDIVLQRVSTSLLKFHGSIKLYKSTSDQFPITLTFSEGNTTYNSLTYHSLYSSENQTKFNDFGFSYDRGMIHLEYSSLDGTYSDSGMIIGKIHEDVEHGETDFIKFMRCNDRNVESVDTTSVHSLFHIGDADCKYGTFSVFGYRTLDSYTDSDGNTSTSPYLSILLYHFNGKSVNSISFRTRLKYDLQNGGSESSPSYNANAVISEDRLYIAVTCDVPSSTDKISNTVNGNATGTVGTATFSNISKYCGDGVITIFSFDLSDIDDITQCEDETRYIMKNGALGYFPQYSGIVGKNLMFYNTQLKNDERYPFYAQFDEFESDNGFSLTKTISVDGVDSNGDRVNYGRIPMDRFIDTYDSFALSATSANGNFIRGFAIDDTSEKNIYTVSIDVSSCSGEYRKTDYLGYAGYDVSRGNSAIDFNNTVHLIATNKQSAQYIDAFLCNGDCSSVSSTRELLYTKLNTSVYTDFKEFYDTGSELYALHGDGMTVSLLEVEATSGTLVLSGANSYDGGIYIGTNIPVDGFTGDTDYASYGCGFNSLSTSSYVDSDGNVVELYRCTSYHATNNGTLIRNECTEDVSSYRSVFSMFVEENGRYYPHTVAFCDDSIVVSRFDAIVSYDESGVPVYSGDAGTVKITDTTITSEFTSGRFNTFTVTESDGMLLFTHENDRKTLALKIEYGAEKAPSVECTWNNRQLSKVPSSETVTDVYASTGKIYNILSVNTNSAGYLMYVDKNITFSGSIAEFSNVYEADGETPLAITDVGRCYGFVDVLMVSANGNSVILKSTDGGRTFIKCQGSQSLGIRLIGAAYDRVYGIRTDTKSVVYSNDGEVWKSDGRIVPSEWSVVGTQKNTVLLCNSCTASGFDLDHRVRIVSQSTILDDYGFDTLQVDDDGTVVLCGGLNCVGTIRYARSFAPTADIETNSSSNRTYEIVSFQHAHGIEYSSSYLFGGELFYAPKYSTSVAHIRNVCSETDEPKLEYIDITSEIGRTSVYFNGFEVVNDTLVMYPSDGSKMLAYSDGENSFFNYYTDRIEMNLTDSDKLGLSPNNELLFTPSHTTNDGTIRFVKSCFTGRNDYGLVEIDNGYPIMVKYERISGTESEDWTGDVYQFTFTMLNDKSGESVKIITSPSDYIGGFDKFAEDYPTEVKKSCIYRNGGEAISYTFATVDDDTKYCIYRNKSTEPKDITYDAFSITYDLNTSRRAGNVITYSTETDDSVAGYVSVVEGFAGFEPTELPQSIVPLSGTDGTTTLSSVSAFRRYSYADTAVFSGNYEFLKPSTKEFCIDSNFNFTSVSTQFKTAEGMFEDCINAKFTNSLVITSMSAGATNITSTSCMFRNCANAALPSVDIARATDITASDSMFEGCLNAALSGVTIPPNSTNAANMFKNCMTTTLVSVTGIPDSVIGMSGMFDGCESALLKNFTFGNMEFNAT